MEENAWVDHRAHLNLLVGIHIILGNHVNHIKDVINQRSAIQMKGKRRPKVRRLKHTLEIIAVLPKNLENLILISVLDKV